MLLAGDIGATKTLIGLFTAATRRPKLVEMRSYPTRSYAGLELVIEEFLAETGEEREAIRAATFGVAGPIVRQVAELTNGAWAVDAAALTRRYGFPALTLLNDLEAMAYAVPALRADELVWLQEGRTMSAGNAALIAAGTGLGEALLHNVDGRFVPSPTEGGHADFAPRTAREIALLQHMLERLPRVDYDHVLSGPGLLNIHGFTHDGACEAVAAEPDAAGRPSLISQAALDGRCAGCVRALELFVSIYGSEAGNLALRSMATAGVFLGGGIAPRILPALQDDRFIEAFSAKPPMADLLALVPVAVILNEHAGLLGAAVHANGIAAARRH
jgi:glucokinase